MNKPDAFQAAYVPMGVPTFHQESARRAFEDSLALLRSLGAAVAAPEGPLLSAEALGDFLDTVDPDLIVLQNTTFANGAYAAEVMARFRDRPLVLWTLREPVIDGGRLRLNSLTGAYSAANVIRRFRPGPLPFVYGAPAEERVQKELRAAFQAAAVMRDLHGLTLAQVGHTPPGFGFGRALDGEMLDVFGVHMISVEARELIDRAKNYTDDECADYLADAGRRMTGLENTPEGNRLDFARLYKAYDSFTKENRIGALASRCWPDFFTAFGTPVCAVLGILNDLGVAAACEADAWGALSMYIGQRLTGCPAFFGDPVSLDEEANTITFWHCGTAACSLARAETGAAVGEHCNRHIGPTLEFGCRASRKAALFRVGRTPEGRFRFLAEPGEILDRPQQFSGTSLVFRPDKNAEALVRSTVRDGWEPHYAVLFGDAAQALRTLGDFLDIPLYEF